MSIFISKKEATGEIKKILRAVADGKAFSGAVVNDLDIKSELSDLGYEYQKNEKVYDGGKVGTWRKVNKL